MTPQRKGRVSQRLLAGLMATHIVGLITGIQMYSVGAGFLSLVPALAPFLLHHIFLLPRTITPPIEEPAAPESNCPKCHPER